MSHRLQLRYPPAMPQLRTLRWWKTVGVHGGQSVEVIPMQTITSEMRGFSPTLDVIRQQAPLLDMGYRLLDGDDVVERYDPAEDRSRHSREGITSPADSLRDALALIREAVTELAPAGSLPAKAMAGDVTATEEAELIVRAIYRIAERETEDSK